MNGSPWRRLEQLERLADVVAVDEAETAADREREERSAELAEQLSATMDQDHIHRVNAAWDAGTAVYGLDGDRGAVRLGQVVLELIRAAGRGLDNFKLSLPPIVAAVYLEHDAHPFDQCRVCGLVLPYRHEYWRGNGSGQDHYPSVHFFAACPECGGSIGCWDKWQGGPTLPTPAEKRAALAEWDRRGR